MADRALGIDIGGSTIKAALVDTTSGKLLGERTHVPTPHPSTPDAVAAVVAHVAARADWRGLVGATFPAIIAHGVARSAANVDASWIGTDVDACFTSAIGDGADVVVVNDADAAGIAEARFGAARDVAGVVLVLTLGTGIGSALLVDGRLVPNTELGHLELDGHDAETRAAASVRETGGLSYEQWAGRLQRYLSHVEALFTPDLFVLGGGISADAQRWLPYLHLRTPVRTAMLLNDAGVVGAAIAAVERRGE